MPQTPVRKNRFRFVLGRLHAILPVLLITFTGVAAAADKCSVKDATPPAPLLTYPLLSNRYAVQYSVGGSGWTDALVYISVYGGTIASPYRSDSGYSPLQETSMSFASIPARADTIVRLRVTKLWDAPFLASDHVHVRPTARGIDADLMRDGTVQISTRTEEDFAGEQFILWWDRGSEGAHTESLVFFLNPPYKQPTGSNVKVVTALTPPADLLPINLQGFDTLDFEGTVAIGSTGNGNEVLTVPANIVNIFLGPNAWVEGKFAFDPASTTRRLYGPGVLDVSRFDYERRACPGPDGLYALTSTASKHVLDNFIIDGIVITDHNHAANHILFNSTVNNMKTLGWNGENAALRLGNNTTVSNVFVRSGDDSLMMWGKSVHVTNATVWQNYNGGVINLGWSDNTFGDNSLVDGLYVVKTDWLIPKATSWTALAPDASPLQGQNNAIFASLMIPGTMVPSTTIGMAQPPLYRNIFVEDSPRVLFSLKILPPICADTGMTCPALNFAASSVVNLNIENLFTPASTLCNSIGFQTLPAGYPITLPDGSTMTLPADYTLT